MLVNLLEDTIAQHFQLKMSGRRGERENFTTQGKRGNSFIVACSVCIQLSYNSGKAAKTVLLSPVKKQIICILFILHWL